MKSITLGLLFVAVAVSTPTWAAAQCLSATGARNVGQGAVVGGVLGALVGAAANRNDRGDGAETGAIIGAITGAAVGCWTAHEQAVRAAREDALNARADQIAMRATQLEQYNVELAQKAADLNMQLASASSQNRATQTRVSGRLVSEQRQAQGQLGEVQATLANVNDRMAMLDRRDPDYSTKYAALQRQRVALEGARSSLESILSMSA